MLGLLIRWELVRHLRNYRLLVLLVGGPVLMAAAALSHAAAVHDQRAARPGLSRAAESATNLEQAVVLRPPSRLGFLGAAPREQWGEAAVVRPHLQDVMEADVSERSYLFAAVPLDWTAVVIFFYSLMAVAVSYDAVAGERAAGTLRVLASRPIGRMPLLLGKILGCFFVVAGSLVLGALTGTLVAVAVSGQGLVLSDAVLLALAVAQILAFLLVNVLIGMAASVTASTPEQALQRGLGAWTVLALVVPGLVVVTGAALYPAPSELAFQRNLAIHEQGYRMRLGVSSMSVTEIVRTPGISVAEKHRRVEALEAEIQADQEAALAEMERGYAELRRDHLLRSGLQEEWAARWGALSPHTLLRRSLNRLALAGSSGRREFRRQVGQFEPLFTAFVLEQRQVHREDALESGPRTYTTDDDGEKYELRGLSRIDYSEVPIAADDFPRFTWRPPGAAALAARTLPDHLWMLLFVVAAGAFTLWRFHGYDCR